MNASVSGDARGMESEASLLVLRHGQSLWNARAKWQGSADIDLSDLGRDQARRAAIALVDADIRFGAVVSSQLSRAAETARIIAAHLDLATPRIDDRWREAHAGEWQGLTPDEIRRDWPGYLDEHRRPPGFEPVEQVVARATETALELLRAAIGSAPTLVVSHSGVIRALRRHQGLPADRVPNLGGTWIHLVNGEVSVGDDFDPHAAPESSGFDEDAGDEPTRVG
ncbi:MAG: histidine phosphatase family protein [Ilumatobacteraceae bacterium]